jgi:CzcA family heavy metal efflux pump
MIERIIQWSLQNKLIVIIASALLLFGGTWVATQMSVDVFPDLTAPTVTVITEAHGMAPDEVETLVTFPVESAMNGASRVRRVRSATAAGISVVWVEFEWGTDIYAARQVVNEKLQLIAGSLPPEISSPVLAPISSIMGEILFIALTSDKQSPMELRTVADWTLRRRLLAVPGVAQVTPIGGDEKQYQVLIDPVRLGAHQLTTHDVIEALRASNQNASAGFLASGGQEYLIRGIGRIREVADIENSVIAVRNGQPIYIKNVASIQIGAAVKRGEGSFNAKPAVVIGVQKQPNTNTLKLTKTLDKVLDEIQASLPEGMKIERHVFRQADFIEVAIENLLHALRDGTLFVIVILIFFLADFRATTITLLAIPLSLVAAILALKGIGATINTMTLGGLAIAIGALVDDAVIDVENVLRRMKENVQKPEASRLSPFQVILDATLEIRPSIVFATVIIMLVFIPIFFLSGVEGRLLQPLGFAFVIALFASLVISLLVTPALCLYLIPHSKKIHEKEESRLVRWLKSVYQPHLYYFIDKPKLIQNIAILLTILAIGASFFTGRAFLPEFNEGALTISAVTLPGTSLQESDKLGRLVEETMLTKPEFKAVARRTGRAELDEHAQGVEAAELDVSIQLKKRSKKDFLEDLRRSFSMIPGMNITIGQPISHRIDHMLSGTRANLAVKIFGGDLYELRRIAGQVRDAMKPVKGIVDLSIEQQSNVPVFKIKFDRQSMAQYGLKMEDVSEILEAVFLGNSVSRILEGQNSFDLVVRYQNSSSITPDTLGNILVDTHDGKKIPLKFVAQIIRDSGPNMISRENVQRKIVVMCNVSGRALGQVVKDVQKSVAAKVKLPEGYYVEYGGQFEAEQEASKRLFVLGIIVILAIAMILWIVFKSMRDALFIMLNLPLALIGGIAGVFLSGGVLSIASLIGFITLFGIATRNGIMLISHIKHLMEVEGVKDFKEAVIRGSLERLSPILMTALCAGLALIPLALSGGKPGSEIQTPMAIVILCGLVSSTLLNMIVVPVLYYAFGRPKEKSL